MSEFRHKHPEEPSPWVRRFAPLIPKGGRVLDLACGYGRHARFLAGLGHAVEAVDRDAEGLATLAGTAGVTTRQADLEEGPWPYGGGQFAGIVGTNYLHRPLLPHLIAALQEDGVLIYDTFMVGNERFGRPSNPDFLLQPEELLGLVLEQLLVVAFEQGEVLAPKPAVVQRICAVKASVPPRLP
ncbi:MAG: class I SAM-dependent methyltransferase [Rhodocyclales bacterium]|nr:class I SAM-dependent methyltransferase [Rhodocyclales bacterium]